MTLGSFRVALGLNGFAWAHVMGGKPYEFDQVLRFAHELGFEGIELFALPEPFPVTARDQRRLRKRVLNEGLRVASIQSLPGGLANGHPGSAYTLCRQAYVDYIRSMLEVAVNVGCDTVGVWAGELLGTATPSWLVDNLVATYTECAEAASQAGIPLCIEAEPVQLVNSGEIWLKVLEGVNSPYFRALFDFSHANVLTKKKPLGILKKVQEHIGYVHICDNDGTCSESESRSSKHFALGEGKMAWEKVLGALLDGGYTGWLTLDLWEHDEPRRAAEVSKNALDAFLRKRE